jgi:hypothetical protein
MRETGKTLIGVPATPEVPLAPSKLISGAEGKTPRTTDVVPIPTEFFAVTIYELKPDTSVGVPEMTQVSWWIQSPWGRFGMIEQSVMGEPFSSKRAGAMFITLLTYPRDPVTPM